MSREIARRRPAKGCREQGGNTWQVFFERENLDAGSVAPHPRKDRPGAENKPIVVDFDDVGHGPKPEPPFKSFERRPAFHPPLHLIDFHNSAKIIGDDAGCQEQKENSWEQTILPR
jgi:hypothetical protein